MKGIALILVTALVIVGWQLWKSDTGDDEIFVLPHGFSGTVYIFYQQSSGAPLEYDRGKRIYRIPSNGILNTQFSFNAGWRNFGEFYYRQEGGDLLRLPYRPQAQKPGTNELIDPKEVRVCCISSGKSYFDDGHGFVEFEQFFVGTDEEVKRARETSSSINPITLLR